MAEYTLNSLVETILDLGQADIAERGDSGVEAEGPADVATTLASVVAERRDAITRAGITLIDRIDPDTPCVPVCRTAVRQMISHLLGIAVGSCDAGNTVVLTNSRDDELVKISLVDDGRPFARSDIPDDLYDTLDAVVLRPGRGERTDTDSAESVGGSGVGEQGAASAEDKRVTVTPMGLTLAVIHALLARQRGMLEVSNRPNGGKQIVLAFPLEEAVTEAGQGVHLDEEVTPA